ncbi:MAG: hypothetical protein R3E82_11330 [Pseudomonadales bacterium]|nr:hypothetical protein [Pseudomonadales bacterium]
MRLFSASTTVSAAVLTMLWLIGTLHAPRVYADDGVTTMAAIVLSLAHFPSDADKAVLAAIAQDEGSASVKTVASAIAGISHKVSDADRTRLLPIAADENEPADLRELAGIVAGINHMPGADARAALTALAGR